MTVNEFLDLNSKKVCHTRESGYPEVSSVNIKELDSRFRGNDKTSGH
jgi:hypothetical protein